MLDTMIQDEVYIISLIFGQTWYNLWPFELFGIFTLLARYHENYLS